ncbi:MAG: hypothetical protein M1834_002000 [Cirrosporium novae-zelandiae]|nr:MAG: hypothetical protein M1834_002000 [Cirrosporium novae-zelandiae]
MGIVPTNILHKESIQRGHLEQQQPAAWKGCDQCQQKHTKCCIKDDNVACQTCVDFMRPECTMGPFVTKSGDNMGTPKADVVPIPEAASKKRPHHESIITQDILNCCSFSLEKKRLFIGYRHDGVEIWYRCWESQRQSMVVAQSTYYFTETGLERGNRKDINTWVPAIEKLLNRINTKLEFTEREKQQKMAIMQVWAIFMRIHNFGDECSSIPIEGVDEASCFKRPRISSVPQSNSESGSEVNGDVIDMEGDSDLSEDDEPLANRSKMRFATQKNRQDEVVMDIVRKWPEMQMVLYQGDYSRGYLTAFSKLSQPQFKLTPKQALIGATNHLCDRLEAPPARGQRKLRTLQLCDFHWACDNIPLLRGFEESHTLNRLVGHGLSIDYDGFAVAEALDTYNSIDGFEKRSFRSPRNGTNERSSSAIAAETYEEYRPSKSRREHHLKDFKRSSKSLRRLSSETKPESNDDELKALQNIHLALAKGVLKDAQMLGPDGEALKDLLVDNLERLERRGQTRFAAEFENELSRMAKDLNNQ